MGEEEIFRVTKIIPNDRKILTVLFFVLGELRPRNGYEGDKALEIFLLISLLSWLGQSDRLKDENLTSPHRPQDQATTWTTMKRTKHWSSHF